MSDGEVKKHKRRKRYPGRNPRRFQDRYKEHNPQKYPEHAKHIEAKGSTLAGSHRPICVQEILEILAPQPGETALDATLGYGGHASKLLPLLGSRGLLFALDADPIELSKTTERLRSEGFDEDVFVPRQMNFSGARSLLYEAGGGFDCVLADLGVSSMQLDNPERGFSFKTDGPLDLRLNPNKGKSCSQYLNDWTKEELESILSENADEPFAIEIACALESASPKPQTTTELKNLIENCLRKTSSVADMKKSVQRSFMALRIAVNQEFESLERFLKVLPQCLKAGGRVAILSFHSGEDRRVKRAFAEGFQLGYYSAIADKPIRPTKEECYRNPRASCAKLRWAVRSDIDVTVV